LQDLKKFNFSLKTKILNSKFFPFEIKKLQ
jgi:hypothetical protein